MACTRRYVHWQCPGSQNYTPFFCLRVGQLTLLQFPPPPFFSGRSGRLAFQKKERVKPYTQLKKSAQSLPPEHPGTANYYYCLTHTVLQERLIIKLTKAILLLSPLTQKFQYNKQNRAVLRCSLAQAEPRSQYIQLDYMVN